jgi:hypothetical protein
MKFHQSKNTGSLADLSAKEPVIFVSQSKINPLLCRGRADL